MREIKKCGSVNLMWTVVQLEHRKEYTNSLGHAHTEMDIHLFLKFILEEMKRSKKIWNRPTTRG